MIGHVIRAYQMAECLNGRGTTYGALRLSPLSAAVQPIQATPTREVSCRYWRESSTNSMRPSPRARASRRVCDWAAQRAGLPSRCHAR